MVLSTFPNQVAAIEKSVLKRFPEAKVTIDAPTNSKGSWFLDIRLHNHVVTVEWKRGNGFGITTNPSNRGYGEGVDEIHTDPNSAYRRVVSLLLAKANTVPPESVRLRELRAVRGISQVELAGSLRVQQAAISRLEGRNDILLSTLKAVITALGGELNITARFPGGLERQIHLENHAETPSPVSKNRRPLYVKD